ncbi:ATP-dependent DNA ligase [Leifsonia shinshuensis]|uniref:DUF7882 family protein n=1 Tax=Leifsonia shinshuensis TaxID=150026 RepID=UPI00286CA0FA|nr:ATP-dependent DNA ligase [Leifsonia shinshuensis]
MLYDQVRIEFPDRELAHLQVVILSKLRRHESFAMSWREPAATGGGRSTIWLDSAHALYFRFDGSRWPELSHEWVERLRVSASSPTGLLVTDEDGDLVSGTSVLLRGASGR